MRKYTATENATRKQVFEYIRKNYGHCTQREVMNKFGSGKIVKAAIKEANTRIVQNLDTPKESTFDRVKKIVSKKANLLARCLPSSGYSMGERKYVVNKFLDVCGSYNNTQQYANSCTWKPTHGSVSINLPLSLIVKLEALEGMMTLRGKQIQKGIWKCQWLEFDYTRNGRGIINSDITYHMVNGYVVIREESLWTLPRDIYFVNRGWYHTTSLSDARSHNAKFIAEHKEYLKKQRAKAKAEALYREEREKKAKAEARRKAKEAKELDKQVKRISKSAEIKDALNHGYVYADSIKAGNCVPGTNGFIADHNLHKDDTRTGDFLMRISKGTYQHTNVIRILVNYIKNTYNDFFVNNEKAINIVLKNI